MLNRCSTHRKPLNEQGGLADADGDGYNTATDCNDGDANINPGQAVDTVGDDAPADGGAPLASAGGDCDACAHCGACGATRTPGGPHAHRD